MKPYHLVAGLLLVALPGCATDPTEPSAGDSETTEIPAAPTVPETTSVPIEQPVESEPSRCLAVPVALRKEIANGEAPGVRKLVISAAAAVKSADYQEVYMIAGRVEGIGADNVGVWATNKLKPGGVILAVDAVAKTYTQWLHGDRAQAGVTHLDDGVAQARDCLQATS